MEKKKDFKNSRLLLIIDYSALGSWMSLNRTESRGLRLWKKVLARSCTFHRHALQCFTSETLHQLVRNCVECTWCSRTPSCDQKLSDTLHETLLNLFISQSKLTTGAALLSGRSEEELYKRFVIKVKTKAFPVSKFFFWHFSKELTDKEDNERDSGNDTEFSFRAITFQDECPSKPELNRIAKSSKFTFYWFFYRLVLPNI